MKIIRFIIFLSFVFINLIVAQDAVVNDSLKTTDTTKVKKVPYLKTSALLDPASSLRILNKREILKEKYEYTGDLLKVFPFSFLRDLSFPGYPSENMLYGYGNGNTSILENGMNLNNRFMNSLDLFHFQSEFIDSIEFIPLSRGFLYGNEMNPVSLNFITRDNIQKIPYTRIRVLQAPNEEGYVDAYFNAYIFKKFNLSFEATNNATADYYDNTEYGTWKVSTRMRYLYSQKLNFVGSFIYHRSEIGLNGGAIPDSSDIYNNIDALVYYKERYKNEERHYYNFKILSEFIEKLPTDISLYYLYDEQKYRQNKSSAQDQIFDVPVIKNNNKSVSAGINVTQAFNFDFFSLKGNLNYEDQTHEIELDSINTDKSRLAISAIANTYLFDSLATTSFYGKQLTIGDKLYAGLGADISFKFDKFKLFGGISYYKKPLSFIERHFIDEVKTQKLSNLEVGMEYNGNHLSTSLSYFASKNDNQPYAVFGNFSDSLLSRETSSFIQQEYVSTGVNLILNYNFWHLYFESNTSYYFDMNKNLNAPPEITSNGGIYFKGILFNSNLDLKAGISYQLIGKQNFYKYDFQLNRPVFFEEFSRNSNAAPSMINGEKADPNFVLDLFIAGTFQERATVYVTFENILDKDYYITPYYPKQELAFRLGISWEFYN